MNCRICGAELKGRGELCNNCMNKLVKEQELRNDKTPVFSFRRKFVLGYEIFKQIESICIVIFMIILLLSVSMEYWRYAVIIGCLFLIYDILKMWYTRIKVNSGICVLYRTKLIIQEGIFKKKIKEIPYSEIDDISYTVGRVNKLFNVGTIIIRRKTKKILDRHVNIDSVKDLESVIQKFNEVMK